MPWKKESLISKYSHITDCPLNLFIDNMCGELTLLYWDQIYSEYIYEIKDTDYVYLLKLESEINGIKFKLNKIQLSVTLLEKYLYIYLLRKIDFTSDKEELIKSLKKELFFSGKFDFNEPKKYLHELEMIVSRSKQFVTQLDLKEDERTRLLPKGENKKIDKITFDKLLANLSQYMKFYIHKNTVTVSEFVAMYINMRDSVKKLKDA